MQNDYLSEWVLWRASYLNIVLGLEAPFDHPPLCSTCKEAQGTIRCISCLGNQAWCSSCAVKAHQSLPFHRLQKWNDRFYGSITLQELGYVLHLGHGGCPCPLQERSGMSSQNFTFVDSAGIFIHTVRWCQCQEATQADKHLQLLGDRLFPATIINPQTAFTFNVLDEFLIDSMECKTSASSFYQKLKRLTNNTFPDSVPVGGSYLLCRNGLIILGNNTRIAIES